MKAVIKQAPEPGALEWVDWPEPDLRPGHVIVEIERAGICSTDVAIYDWTYRGRQPLATPSMLGHEASGTVVAAADDVRVATGTRVGLQVIWGRPHSRETLEGHENLDPEWIHIGASALGGTFAERIAMPAERLVLLPEELDWDQGALLEPLAVAANAMDLVAPRPGESFVVVGPGPFGLLMIQIARAAGATPIVAVGLEGIDASRLAVATTAGADAVVELGGDMTAATEAVLATVGRRGADVVVDAGGTPESTFLSLDLAGPAGRVAVFGFTREATIEPLRQVIRKGLSLHGVSAAARRHYGIALRLMESGAVDPREIVSHRVSIAEAGDGIELVKSRVATKVLLGK